VERKKALLSSEDEVDLMQEEAKAGCVYAGVTVEASLIAIQFYRCRNMYPHLHITMANR
jgi:hypothetical protein